MSGETYDILNSIFSGQMPLRRTNPKAGESEYYYVVPGQEDWTSLTDVKTVDVSSANTPNPYLQTQNNTFSQPAQFVQNNAQIGNAVEKSNAPVFDGDIVNPQNNLYNNFSNWIEEKNRIASLPISDVNKHQYMMCLASKGGWPMQIAGITAAIGKEGADLIKKTFIPSLNRQYGGLTGILADGAKDARNNGIGARFGQNSDNDCQSLLRNPIF